MPADAAAQGWDLAKILLAAGGSAGLTQAYNAWRVNRRADRTETTQTVAEAADRVTQSAAATLEAMLAPLRAELAAVRAENAALREEVHALREALQNQGCPALTGDSDCQVLSIHRAV